MWLFGHSPCQSSLSAQSFSFTSFPTLYVSLHTTQWPRSLPVNEQSLSLDSAFTPRILRPAYPSQLVVAMGCRNVTHTDVPIPDWAVPISNY
ncbi:hypothetical protein K443DRAFT_256141 [Laccaria amethystina LaAM-08-1]|uniref:Uncharacterized protein n=1 Tax=Laccaria amethystina LaAM-08-1 TaxID=1095629 RepID=A0A0C9X7C5_9AGAR|nr:hypothetical protein K443DRAFT_256141 [Laccaria amethystina LaAM-08-1]